MSDLELLNHAIEVYGDPASRRGAVDAETALAGRVFATEAEEEAARAALDVQVAPLSSLDQLVQAGILPMIPPAPMGKKYALDPKTGRAALLDN